jgi:hypothetical protein
MEDLLAYALSLDEPTRRCPHCRALVRRCDEQRGQCPACGGVLLSLVGEIEHSTPKSGEGTVP